MSAHPYSEEQLVEQPAIDLFAKLGWQAVLAKEEVLGTAGTLGRETKGDVILVPRLRSVLERLNPALPSEAVSAAIDELLRDRSAMSSAAANREVYGLLKEGVKVSVADIKHGGQKTERVRVIDWQDPGANEFLLVSQMSITGELYTCRPDLIGFVNGLPLVVIELKKPGVPARAAFDDNLTHYKAQIPQLFWSNALLIASNGTESRVGSLTASWEHFAEWKKVENENEPPAVSLEKAIRGTCEPGRLLDLIENFTLFSEHKSGLTKILAKNHQFLGVNNAIAGLQAARGKQDGRLGVFWHTQGSGKSLSMVFFAQKVLRKVPGNWTFVVVTDRTELDDQIYRTFAAAGATNEHCQAESATHLRQLLSENHRYVFTLIHKFRTENGEPHPVLSERGDIIVMNDEAHRSQYDTLALNMRTALPNASFLAFTGTPLLGESERTREVFGDYVSIYDFQQSVEDGATVPLYYENRTPELELINPDLNEEIYNLIEAAALDPEQEVRLEKELSKQYHILTRDERLETVARDIVHHFLGRGFQGKVMSVAIDKATALRMYDKVRKQWAREQARVEKELARFKGYGENSDPEQVQVLSKRLETLKTTDMALIVSPGQNEIEQMKKLGLDIASHRKRMNEEALDEKFKDPKDPLRLVFVCAMWLTGFDAPSCSTVYLDKPMRNHTLMQTIARANRVYPGKHSGLIVDYANVFASLEKALAMYGKGRSGERPLRDKKQLIEELRKALEEAVTFCSGLGVHFDKIEAAKGLDRLGLIGEAVERLISPDKIRKGFLGHEKIVTTLYSAVKPDPAASEFSSRCACLATIADSIRLRTGEGTADISAIMGEINELLDRSIAAEGFRIKEESDEGDRLGARPGIIDLTAIDFEALQKRFKESKHKNLEIEALKAAVRAQLEKLIQFNRTRVDYLQKFEELIESYNSGSRNIEELLKELIAFTRGLNEEQQRHARESLTEEELTVFDLLTRPDPELSEEEREEVKKVAKQLLTKLHKLLVLDWRKRSGSRAQVRIAIEDTLDEGLPRAYTPEIYQRKCAALFEHIYESYQGDGSSIYIGAA